MSQVLEEYVNKMILEQNKEIAKSFLQNGGSIELVKKCIPDLPAEFIEELSRQFTAVG